MLQQSVLAQKFLPLIKAYLTATIIGLSWLIIIFAIITGYTNLRILLTMYLFLLYWTPVLGMINYLNDLFLENKFNTFQKYTDSLFGFNIAFNTEFFICPFVLKAILTNIITTSILHLWLILPFNTKQLY